MTEARQDPTGKPQVVNIGSKFWRLTVIEFRGHRKNWKKVWRCRCECGNECNVQQGNLRNGHTRSCGCLLDQWATRRFTTHGYTRTPTYWSWRSMLARCYNPKCVGYARWGGRGIKVCDRWRSSFQNFFADLGERPPGTTLGRRRNNEDYSPDNCRWETREQQGNNTRRNVFMTYNGETLTASQWAKKAGVNYHTLWRRVKEGWPAEYVLSASRWPALPADAVRAIRAFAQINSRKS